MYYNISFDIAAILVLLVLAVGMRTVLYTETRGHLLVSRYVYAVLVCAILDIITAYTICYGPMVPDFLNLILNTLFQYSSIACVAAAMGAILNYYPSASRVSIMINRVLLLLLAGLVTMNLFTGWMFRFVNGEYIHGSLYMFSYVLSLAIVFHMLFVVVKNRADRPVIVTRIILLFLFLPTVFTGLQILMSNVLLISFGEAFSAIIMLFALETPDYRKLMKTMSELEIAREEANVANRSKSDFLASMSHEIRTPINGILGMNTMILRDSKDPQITEYAENIRVAGNGLLSIINDILDVSKIESGKLEIRPDRYELYSIMNDCYQMNRMRAAEKGLSLLFENDPAMPSEYLGDEVRVRQIMNNLVTNGIKYTKEGSVKLSVSCTPSCADQSETESDFGTLVISVTDTGIGIREEDLNSLFERFTRLDENTNKNIEGTGLGLHITQRLITMMDGTIDVKSEYGKGSVFTVRIPQKILSKKPMGDFSSRLKEPLNAAKNKVRTFKAKGKRVLIVDDTKINIMVFRGLLRDTEITIDSALSGEEGIALTKKRKYDIIFMDHRMPVMDGVEAFHRIQDDPENPNQKTPTVALTANALVGARTTYLEEGFTDYLSKPIEQQELLAMTEQLLQTIIS